MWRTFWHTDPVTCLRVFTRAWVAVWRALAASPVPAACGKGAALGLALLTPAAAVQGTGEDGPLPPQARHDGGAEAMQGHPLGHPMQGARFDATGQGAILLPTAPVRLRAEALSRAAIQDDAALVLVPEPPTWLLLAVAVVGAILVRRRSRWRQANKPPGTNQIVYAPRMAQDEATGL